MSTVETPKKSGEEKELSAFDKAAIFLKERAEERAKVEAELKAKKDAEEVAKQAEKDAKKKKKSGDKSEEPKEEVKPVLDKLPNADLVRERVTTIEKNYLSRKEELKKELVKALSDLDEKLKAMKDEEVASLSKKYTEEAAQIKTNATKGIKTWNDFLKHAGVETVKVVDELAEIQEKVGDIVVPEVAPEATPEVAPEVSAEVIPEA